MLLPHVQFHEPYLVYRKMDVEATRHVRDGVNDDRDAGALDEETKLGC